jgi:hypothetical protein
MTLAVRIDDFKPTSIVDVIVAAGCIVSWTLTGEWLVGAGLVVIWIGWRWFTSHDGPPVLAMAFTFQWVQVTIGMYYHALTGRTPNAIEFSIYRPMVIIGLGCLLSLALGLRIGMKVVRAPGRSHHTRMPVCSWPTLLILYVGALTVTRTLEQFAWEVPGLTQAMLALTVARLAILFIIFRRLSRPTLRWGWISVLLAGEIALGFTGYFAVFREPLVMAALAFLGVFDRGNRRHWLLLGGLILVLVFTGLMWMTIRTEYRRDFDEEASREVRLERIWSLASRSFDRGSDDLLHSVDVLVDRLWAVYYPALAVARVPTILPHTDGSILRQALLHLVTPRLLFPEKEILASDSDMVQIYSGVWVAGREQGTSIAFGYAAESYVDFGIPLMFVPVGVFGLLMGAAYHYWLRLIRNQELAAGLVAAIFWLSLYLFEQSWIKTLGNAATLMVYLGGGALVLDRRFLWRAAAPSLPTLRGEQLETP